MKPMAVENHDQDRDRTDVRRPVPRVIPREQRQKDVADITRDVLKDEVDLSHIEAGLHRTLGRFNKAAFAEREVNISLLKANILLSRALAKLTNELARLTTRLEAIERQQVL
jgi:hypothetical protein